MARAKRGSPWMTHIGLKRVTLARERLRPRSLAAIGGRLVGSRSIPMTHTVARRTRRDQTWNSFPYFRVRLYAEWIFSPRYAAATDSVRSRPRSAHLIRFKTRRSFFLLLITNSSCKAVTLTFSTHRGLNYSFSAATIIFAICISYTLSFSCFIWEKWNLLLLYYRIIYLLLIISKLGR